MKTKMIVKVRVGRGNKFDRRIKVRK